MKAIRWTRHFKVGSEDYEFMYVTGSKDKTELLPDIKIIKGQGDMYRITKTSKGYYELWDSRW